jgi:hypothetical protein
MNTGMQDAINLAWKLAMVMRGNAKERLLDSYSPERNAVGEMVLRNATRLTDMGTLANPVAQSARNLAARFLLGFHAVRNELAATMSEIDIAYRNSPLSSGAHGGARWTPKHYSGSPPGAGGSPRFVLYSSAPSKADGLLKKFPTILEGAARLSPDDSTYIVRPDGYVGLSTVAKSWTEVERYLTQLR